MDSTKKLASDTANEYKRVALRFFKETNLLRNWMEYIETERYKHFVDMYVKKYKNDAIKYNTGWYDRYCCMDILGMCNFESFLEKKKIMDSHAYRMFSCYLAIFWEDEFRKWINKLPYEEKNNVYLDNPILYADDTLIGNCSDWDRLTSSEKDKVKGWKKLKEDGVYRRN